MTIASQSAARNVSLFVFTISIGSVNFFWGRFVGGDAKFPPGPFAQVDQFTSLATERAIWISGIFGFLFASRALHSDM
jgi:hypothetical protein